jgi:hypothetical protein
MVLGSLATYLLRIATARPTRAKHREKVVIAWGGATTDILSLQKYLAISRNSTLRITVLLYCRTVLLPVPLITHSSCYTLPSTVTLHIYFATHKGTECLHLTRQRIPGHHC